jgi:hypothetical protein
MAVIMCALIIGSYFIAEDSLYICWNINGGDIVTDFEFLLVAILVFAGGFLFVVQILLDAFMSPEKKKPLDFVV